MGGFLILIKSGFIKPIVANILTKIVAGIFAYYVHRNFTFRGGRSQTIKSQAPRYFMLLAINIPVSSVVFAILLYWISEPVAAKFIADILCFALTYAVSKYFIFEDKQDCDSGISSSGAGK